MIYATTETAGAVLPSGTAGAGLDPMLVLVGGLVCFLMFGAVLVVALNVRKWREPAEQARAASEAARVEDARKAAHEEAQRAQDNLLLRGGVGPDGMQYPSLPQRIAETNNSLAGVDTKIDKVGTDLGTALAGLTQTVAALVESVTTSNTSIVARLDVMDANFQSLTTRVVSLEEGQKQFLATASDLDQVRLIPQMQRDLKRFADELLQLSTNQHRENRQVGASQTRMSEANTAAITEHVDAMREELRVALLEAIHNVAATPCAHEDEEQD